MTKRRNACIPRPGKDGKTFWHKIGSAFDFEKGTVVFFDSLPVADKEGKIAVHLFEQKDDQQQTNTAAGKRDLDDDIPF